MYKDMSTNFTLFFFFPSELDFQNLQPWKLILVNVVSSPSQLLATPEGWGQRLD